MILLIFWWLLFRPWELEEILLFFMAAAFFLFQNYFSLSAGIFEFKVKDVLLMPLYEPFLWGFYFMKRESYRGTKRATFIAILSI